MASAQNGLDSLQFSFCIWLNEKNIVQEIERYFQVEEERKIHVSGIPLL